MDIRVSVRGLIEFIMRSGDLDNRRSSMSSEDAMAEGSRIHRMIQRKQGSAYRAEVPLSYTYEAEGYHIVIEGRADGVIEDVGKITTIDEIKGTYKDLDKLKKPLPLHLEQAMCYAYMYAVLEEKNFMRVQMTYCNLDTEEIKYFEYEYSYEDLEEWFTKLIEEYKKWTDFVYDWKILRQNTIKKMSFPFIYREGQKELVTGVYQTIYHKKKLFIEAPTGVGKTISTVFPALKAIGENRAEKLFYLTAKTITRTVADDTLEMLRKDGLRLKSVILTAKDKICFCDKPECNPIACPYAKGHFDRINDAIYELITSEDRFSREVIEEYAKKHSVCPFEMSLDLSLFSDAVICDYNYLFDPHVYLKRFFSQGMSKEYIFLIDEAHNLVERGREMYSAVLVKEDFMALKKQIKDVDPILEKRLEKCNKVMLGLKRQCEFYQIEEDIDIFIGVLQSVLTRMEKFLEDHDESDYFVSKEVREAVLNFYFEISHFLMIYELVDDKYVMYSYFMENGSFALKLFCMDPSTNLKEAMAKGKSSILFSATLLPIQYYKKLLGGDKEDYEMYAKSIFNPSQKALFISRDATTKYTKRTQEGYERIASYIHEIVKNRQGNYMVFFPSYAFMKKVHEIYERLFRDTTLEECIVQSESMNEEEREEFLGCFSKEDGRNERMLIGFCIMGGIFGEGIDLKNDSLIGAIIVGNGLPQVCFERDILMNYFNEAGNSGFDYAYRYPGMNKVLQAAGRVIRTAEDVGIIALIEDRFLENSYQKLFPREWEQYEVVEVDTIAKRIEKFWNEWLVH